MSQTETHTGELNHLRGFHEADALRRAAGLSDGEWAKAAGGLKPQVVGGIRRGKIRPTAERVGALHAAATARLGALADTQLRAAAVIGANLARLERWFSGLGGVSLELMFPTDHHGQAFDQDTLLKLKHFRVLAKTIRSAREHIRGLLGGSGLGPEQLPGLIQPLRRADALAAWPAAQTVEEQVDLLRIILNVPVLNIRDAPAIRGLNALSWVFSDEGQDCEAARMRWDGLLDFVGPELFAQTVDATEVAAHLVAAAQTDLRCLVRRKAHRETPESLTEVEIAGLEGVLLLALEQTRPLANSFRSRSIEELPGMLGGILAWRAHLVYVLEGGDLDLGVAEGMLALAADGFLSAARLAALQAILDTARPRLLEHRSTWEGDTNGRIPAR